MVSVKQNEARFENSQNAQRSEGPLEIIHWSDAKLDIVDDVWDKIAVVALLLDVEMQTAARRSTGEGLQASVKSAKELNS